MNDVQERVRSIVGGVVDVMTVRRVFGEPIEREGVSIVPVAHVRGAFGVGTGGGEDAQGVGGGGGVSASPAGVYVIRGGDVHWEPATDANRTVMLGCTVAVIALLTLRSVARSFASRPAN